MKGWLARVALLVALAGPLAACCGDRPTPAPSAVTTPPTTAPTTSSPRPSSPPPTTAPTTPPTTAPTTPPKTPPTSADAGNGGGFVCLDGSTSHVAHRQGACSHHGGIR